jgi:hypothetical protein
MAEHTDGPDLAFLLEIFVDDGWPESLGCKRAQLPLLCFW